MRTALVVSADEALRTRLRRSLDGRAVFTVSSDEEALRTLRFTAVHRERLRVNQDLRVRLWVLGTVAVVGALGTVLMKKAVHSALSLAGRPSLSSAARRRRPDHRCRWHR